MTNGKKKALGWAIAGGGAVLAIRSMTRLYRSLSLVGRTVLITGGSRGLGLVIAREFIREGAHVAIAARDPDELDRAKADLVERGGSVLSVQCDVTDRGQVDEMVGTVLDAFGHIDIVINNAGLIQVGPVEAMTTDDYEAALRTHFWAPLYTTLAVLPGMRKRRMGRIVNISSLGGKISMPHLIPYGASKFALTGLSEGLRAELINDGIYVTTVIPGLMRTGSPINAFFKGQHRAEYAWFAISDSVPFLSMSAESAARQILNACRYGDAELILSLPAKLAVRLHGLFPGVMTEFLGLANRVLPAAVPGATQNVRGRDSISALSPPWATKLSDLAAIHNNEVD